MSPFIYTLPFIAAAIGWFTNYIAVKMLFRPHKRIEVLGIGVQGIFPKRQAEVAVKIGKLVSEELLSIKDIKEKVTNPKTLAVINESIEEKLDDYMDNTLPNSYPMMSLLVRPKVKSRIKSELLTKIDNILPQVISKYLETMERDLNIEKIIQEKITLLSAEKLETLILEVLKKEFQFIEMIGAILGFLIGLVQVGIVMFL